MTYHKNPLPNDLPHEFAVTIRKGVNPKTRTPQWEASYMLVLPAVQKPRNEGNPFARALGHLTAPAESINTIVKVVVNEREWSGPLGEGEVWVVRPRAFLSASRIVFADALFRSPDSSIKSDTVWFHPMVRDIYERMAWDLHDVSSGGQVAIGEWEWSTETAYRGRREERFRQVRHSREGGLKSFSSEGGWLRFSVEFYREAPTAEDYYHREYWTEEFAFPLHECSAGWSLLSEWSGGIGKFISTIYTAAGVAITLPRLLDRSWRGAAGPFDLSRIGQPRLRLTDEESDQLVASLLPGRLVSFIDRDTVKSVGGSGLELIGVVSTVLRDREGWFVRFERNELFFRASSRRGEPVWRTLGHHHLEERDYRHYIVMSESQRTFAGFAGMRFRSLRLPEHREHGLGSNYELVRHADGLGFEGVLALRGTLPANSLLGDGKGGWAEEQATHPFMVDVFGDGVGFEKFRHRSFPEHLMRRFF